MKLSIATNFDSNLLQKFAKYNIKEVYGALPNSILGSVLPAPFLPKINKKNLKKTVEKAHNLGIKFNYILNSSCSGGLEYSRSKMKKLRSFLDWLSEIEVDMITVALPNLIDLIVTNYPNLKVKVSVVDAIDSLQKARFFEEMGASAISVDINHNRNFTLLRKLSEHLNIEISLVVNNLCLWGCPFRLYHGTSSSHTKPTQGYYNNYCDFKCRIIKTENPSEMIKSRWIRPEDLKFYEELGISSFKIAGRTKSSEFLKRAAKSYSQRKFDGNLIDILNTYEEVKNKPNSQNNNKGFEIAKENFNRIPANLLKIAFFLYGKFPGIESRNIINMLSRMPSYLIKPTLNAIFNSKIPIINNRELEGFIHGFEEKDCTILDCNECGYCKRIAEKSITFPKEKRSLFLRDLKNYIQILNR